VDGSKGKDRLNLTTIQEIRPATSAQTEPTEWRAGDSWLAGGTWLFSEPQPHLRRLLDLQAFGWEPLEVSSDGLRIAATCTIAQLNEFAPPPDWLAAPLIQQCSRALLASFKIWNAATVGGNICMSLPAGAMISLTAALEGVCTLLDLSGGERRVVVEDFVTGDHQNVLRPGEVLRAIDLPNSALRKRTSFRQQALTKLGRSTALIIGTSSSDGDFTLIVSAATVRPIRLIFPRFPDERTLRAAIHNDIDDAMYHDDVHGSPAYRKHLTFHFAEEIRREFAAN
jgi:CO/xanthine dehydrogenase FAD-binding subunit